MKRIYEIFEAPTARAGISISMLNEQVKSGNARDIDRALVDVIVDWIYMGTKYDHWISANIKDKDGEAFEHCRRWLEDLKKTGIKVRELNWLLVARNMKLFRRTVKEINEEFQVLFAELENPEIKNSPALETLVLPEE